MKLFYDVNRRAGNENGFTIIEVMIVIGVFAIGILAVANMQITAFRANRAAMLQTNAITRGSERMENLISQNYAAIVSGNETVENFNISWAVSDNTPLPDTKTIAVTVTWNDMAGPRNMTLNHIVAKLD